MPLFLRRALQHFALVRLPNLRQAVRAARTVGIVAFMHRPSLATQAPAYPNDSCLDVVSLLLAC
jgi:hypothetical protein